MQLLTFIYADWDLTLSQVLWHKISHNYPSAQAMYSKNMTSYTDISISNFLHAGHALKQRSDAHTHTHTHTLESPFLPSAEDTVNNHSAATRARQFMHEDGCREEKVASFFLRCTHTHTCILKHTQMPRVALKLQHVAVGETITR